MQKRILVWPLVVILLLAGCARPRTVIDQHYLDGASPVQTLDLYLPADKDPALIVMIHGGEWQGGDKEDLRSVAQQFVKRGFAVATVNYRLSTDSNVKNPEHAKDVAAAYAWLADKADSYGYSRTHIFVMGHSSGAHIAAMLATGPYLENAGVQETAMPKGFIGIEGIYDVHALVDAFPAYKEKYIRWAFGDAKNWAAGSPTELPIILKSPWMVIHSNDDEFVDKRQSVDFTNHLKDQNVMAELDTKAAGRHDDVMMNLSDASDPTGTAIQDFIRRHS